MATKPIAHNVYFEGKVQSLGLETQKRRATIRVMKKGSYTFSTYLPEEMIVISRILNVKLTDSDGFKSYIAGSCLEN